MCARPGSYVLAAILALGVSSSALAQNRTIEIAVDILEVRLSDEQQFGLAYEYIRSRGDVLDFDLFLPGTAGPSDPAIPALQMTVDFLNSRYGDLDMTLQAAIRKGEANILSNPRLIVQEGETAHIVTGEEVPITMLEIKGSKQTLKSVSKNTGVKLYVTPSILQEEYIIMSIQAEVSEIAALEGFTPAGSESGEAVFELPRVQRRTVQTVVLAQNQRSIYIGGLISEISQKTTRKVPILGDMPYVGLPFRSKNDSSFFTETWFRITPTIKEPGEGIRMPEASVGSGLSDRFLDSTSIDTATDAILLEEQLEDLELELPFDYEDK